MSGVIVMVSLGALIVVQVPLFRAIAVGVAAAVVAALLVALTLLPALLAGLGSKINFGSLPARFLPADSRAGHIVGGWQRWAKLVMRRPVVFATAAVAVLVLAALPLTGVKFGLDAGMQALTDEPSGHANQLIEDKFTERATGSGAGDHDGLRRRTDDGIPGASSQRLRRPVVRRPSGLLRAPRNR